MAVSATAFGSAPTFAKLAFDNSITPSSLQSYRFFITFVVIFFVTIFYGEKKVRKDQYCKEGLFFQMLFNKCTPRNFLYDKNIQEDI